MHKKDLLVLDFDGVIVDSLKENFILSLKAFNEINNCNKKIITYKKFAQGRIFCKTALDYYLAFKLVYLDPDMDFLSMTHAKWAKLFEKHKEEINRFPKIFYKLRIYEIKNNFNNWIKYQYVYKGIKETIFALKSKFKKIILATARDSYSARKILKHNGINIEIIGREVSINKAVLLTYIKDKYRTDYPDLYFIDDNIGNLLEPKKMGVNVFLAGWGFLPKESFKIAKKYKIPALQLSDFNKHFPGNLIIKN